MIKQVIWSSLIDYPNYVATVIFFEGCNYNCNFCYNKELSKMKEIDFDLEIMPKLLERKDFINHVILSGGECTESIEFRNIVQKLYLEGFTIGIHTNGSNPDVVENNLEEISFLGIDIKTNWDKYEKITRTNDNIENVQKTIKLAIDNNKDYQIRTTMVPEFVTKDDCEKIAIWLKENNVNKYTLQQYYIVGSAEINKQYTEDELKQIQDVCNQILPTSLKIK